MTGPGTAAYRVRTERAGDHAAVRAVTAAAFAEAQFQAPPVEPDGAPGEATLVGWLRADAAGFVPELSVVAVAPGGEVVGHAIATRGGFDGESSSVPAPLGLGPVSVLPQWQGRGIGSGLVREVLARADALGHPVVVLVGDPAFYSRLGFVPAVQLGIPAPVPEWVEVYQATPLSAWGGGDVPRRFRYAAPFDRL
ncbi:MAG: N-acetyltransferase [Micrococcales bacterium]|nr:N-acetyltransferase [Micrococcales bacterium]